MKINKLLLTGSLLFLVIGILPSNLNSQTHGSFVGNFERLALNPIFGHDQAGDFHIRSAYLYSDHLFDGLEEDDAITQLQLFRFTELGTSWSPHELTGNTNLKIYGKKTTDNQLGPSAIDWDVQTQDAKLLFEGPVNQILGEEGYPDEEQIFEFNEDTIFWGDQGENLALYFDFYAEESQTNLVTWVSSTESTMPYDDFQAYGGFAVDDPPDFIDTADMAKGTLKPDIQLNARSEQNVELEVAPYKELHPYPYDATNYTAITFSNQGYKSIEDDIEVTLEITGDINETRDTVISNLNSLDTVQILWDGLPVPNEEGLAQHSVTVENLNEQTTLASQARTQEFTEKKSANVFRNQEDLLLSQQMLGDYIIHRDFLSEAVSVEGMEFFVPDTIAAEGVTVEAHLFDGDQNILTSSDPKTIQLADLGGYVEMEFNPPVNSAAQEEIFFGLEVDQNHESFPYLGAVLAENFSFSTGVLNQGPNEDFGFLSSNINAMITGVYAEPSEALSLQLVEPLIDECQSEEVEVRVGLTNNTTQSLSNFEVEATIDGDNDDKNLSSNYTDALEPDEVDEINLGTFNSKETGDVEITLSHSEEDFEPEAFPSHEISFHPLPSAEFSYEISEENPFEVQLSADEENLEGYFWDMGDGNSLIGPSNETYEYDAGGEYEVTLEVTDENNCSATSSESITLTENIFLDLIEPEEETCASDAQPLTVQISNNTASSQSNLELTAAIEGEDRDETISSTYTQTIDPDDTEEFTMGDFSSLETGDADITLVVEDDDLAPEEEMKHQVSFLPLPSAEFSVEADEDNPNEVTFEAEETELDGYAWDMGDGTTYEDESQITHEYDDAGDYEVNLATTNVEGCASESSQEIEVDEKTFLGEQLENVEEIEIYPNPVTDQINIALTSPQDEIKEVTLMTLAGQELHVEKPKTGSEEMMSINISSLNLENGIYLLNVTTERFNHTERILVK